MFDFNVKPRQETFKAYGSISSIADIIETQLPSYGDRPAIRFDTGDGYRQPQVLMII